MKAYQTHQQMYWDKLGLSMDHPTPTDAQLSDISSLSGALTEVSEYPCGERHDAHVMSFDAEGGE